MCYFVHLNFYINFLNKVSVKILIEIVLNLNTIFCNSVILCWFFHPGHKSSLPSFIFSLCLSTMLYNIYGIKLFICKIFMPHYFTHSVVNENYLSVNINCQYRTISLAILKTSPFTLAHLLLISFSLLWWIFVLILIIMARCMNIIYSNNFFITPSFFSPFFLECQHAHVNTLNIFLKDSAFLFIFHILFILKIW